jgi:hypothetical protein
MTLGRSGCTLAVLTVVCVLAVFFFPAVEGPYSVVNGPVTALLSARAAAGVRMAIVHAGLNPVHCGSNFTQAAETAPFGIFVLSSEFETERSPIESSLILRC